jgi:putative ABC transport system permease protein
MAGDLQIVGVVSDIRHDGLQASARAEVFVPYDQFPLSQMQVVVSTSLDSAAVAKGVRSQLAALDPSVPIARVSTIEDLVSASIAQPRFNMTLLAALALCAALLAAVGVYSVVTYSVTRRTAELADGARRRCRAHVPLVVGGALKVVLVGVAGLGGAALAGCSLGTSVRRSVDRRADVRGQRARHHRHRSGCC